MSNYIRATGIVAPDGLGLEPWEDYEPHHFPPPGTKVQIEVTPIGGPTRRDLLRILKQLMDDFAHEIKGEPISRSKDPCLWDSYLAAVNLIKETES